MIPNSITFLRILLIPLFIAAFTMHFAWHFEVAAFLFILAGVTDWADGYLARRLNQTSPLGTFLDPVADKLLVATALVLIAISYQNIWITLAALTIILREITVSALRDWMSSMGKSQLLAVSNTGKLKTTLQIIAISGLILTHTLNWLYWPSVIALYGATTLALVSLFEYGKIAIKNS